MAKKKEKMTAYCKATTDAERLEIMREMGQRRWAGVSKEERKKFGDWAATQGGGAGRPPSRKARCPCGAMTLKRARSRADIHGTGLGHKRGCSFFRLLPRIAPKKTSSKENTNSRSTKTSERI